MPQAQQKSPSVEQASGSNGRRLSLAQLKPGQTGTVLNSQLDPDDAAMLRAMGLCANAQIKLCSPGQPCIVSVLGAHGCCCRIGLAPSLAQRVVVGVDE